MKEKICKELFETEKFQRALFLNFSFPILTIGAIWLKLEK